MRKYLQRKLYDTLTSRNGVLTVLLSLALIVSSAFYFGEAIVEWSSEKYAVVFNSFSDNLLGKSYRTRLCLPVPIDVVYTWVNGTDPQLLAGLRQAKSEIEQLLSDNKTTEKPSGPTTCQYANCVKAPLAVFSAILPAGTVVDSLAKAATEYKSVYKLDTVLSDDMNRNFTIAYFASQIDVEKAVNVTVELQGIQYTAKQGYYTSDITIPNSKLQSTIILISGFKRDIDSEEVSKVLPKHVMDKVYDYEMKGRVGIFRTATSSDAEALLGFAYNFTVDNRYLQINKANLVYDLTYSGKDKDLSANRFEDNEELRYSLRSLEQYAPWVRHIYIVTNGQIPYWLNLDNPRLTIITHQDIFLNKSHLPTFSSPAIESHLHRIPGLSDKFLYLNDDVMLGAQAWPDDFYTHSKGQKVYLSWNIPDCAPGCPQTWLKDGYCDRACNVSECSFDAGDCDGNAPAFQAGNWQNQGHWADNRESTEQANCAPGCSNPWIADKYCDASCNTKECGFDAGDCTLDEYHTLHQITIIPSLTDYHIPAVILSATAKLSIFPGVCEAYLNFSSLSSGKVSSASHDSNPAVRVAAVSNKYHIITVLLLKNYTAISFNMSLTIGEQEAAKTWHFTIHGDTKSETALANVYDKVMPKVETNGVAVAAGEVNNKIPAAGPVTERVQFVFSDIPETMREPHFMVAAPSADERIENVENSVDEALLPIEVQGHIKVIQTQLDNEELTQKGFKKRLAKLLAPYQNTTRKGRKLQQHIEQVQEQGFLPWESQADFHHLVKRRDALRRAEVYLAGTKSRRHLMDTFAQSLHHVNDLYNKMFGVKPRKVPGHMPHLIDKEVMIDLQETFKDEWKVTSSHKIRSGQDMQFAFSYLYFLMDSRRNNTEIDFIEEMDIDNSGVLSDRELRTMATRIFDSPLDLQSLLDLENHIVNCSKHLPASDQMLDVPPPQQEVYYQKEMLESEEENQLDSFVHIHIKDMPQVTLPLLAKCGPVLQLIRNKVAAKAKYRYEVVGDEDINFKMIHTNVSTVVGQLDDLRRHPKKFMCLNDNIDHNNPEALQVKALLADFYEGMFPIRSQFELPPDYRNRFLHVDELREWKQYRDYMKYAIEVMLVILVLYTIYSYYEDQIRSAVEKRRLRTDETV